MVGTLASSQALGLLVPSSLTVRLAVNARLGSEGRRLIVFAYDSSQDEGATRLFVAVDKKPRHLSGRPVALFECRRRTVESGGLRWTLKDELRDAVNIVLGPELTLKINGSQELSGTAVRGELKCRKGIFYLH